MPAPTDVLFAFRQDHAPALVLADNYTHLPETSTSPAAGSPKRVLCGAKNVNPMIRSPDNLRT